MPAPNESKTKLPAFLIEHRKRRAEERRIAAEKEFRQKLREKLGVKDEPPAKEE